MPLVQTPIGWNSVFFQVVTALTYRPAARVECPDQALLQFMLLGLPRSRRPLKRRRAHVRQGTVAVESLQCSFGQ